MSKIDARMQLIPTFIVRADDLYAGRISEQSFKINYVQISSKKSFSDLKKRMADVISAQMQAEGQSGDAATVSVKAIRMWLADDKTKLIDSFLNIAASE